MINLRLGLDVGSTTVKLVVLNSFYQTVYSIYKRHYSDVKSGIREVILGAYNRFKNELVSVIVTGSGGLAVHKWLDIPFVQEVMASTNGIRKLLPQTDVAIELGGEDAKITYLTGNVEQRMNSICAGGTGAFIDQMAALLETDAQGLNELAKKHGTIYPIASRCGVFGKTDVQALINQGVPKEDIAASVLQAVVNQTISNLACGRPITGKVAFLGGPLHFLPELRRRYVHTLGLAADEVLVPADAQIFVAKGAAISAPGDRGISFEELKRRSWAGGSRVETTIKKLPPLFTDEKSLQEFKDRHAAVGTVGYKDIRSHKGACYLGLDAGSTTTKAVLIDEDNNILYSYYGNHKGQPLDLAVKILRQIYDQLPAGQTITYAAVTGYGEEFIKAALGVDIGEVETMVHYKAALFFQPEVDFILDVGGQDMKCMRVKDGAIDSIFLNEACSSGCGSFLETFAHSLNMSVEDFLAEGLLAKNPVDLGSRCTVFMNSKVRQAQKEGASIGDIAAGLCYSVIKNALYKVIRVKDPQDLGQNIVVQGGTFYGDAILRAFELISGRRVTRPSIPGLMGAFGAALLAKERAVPGETSGLLSNEQLSDFSYVTNTARCGGCGNNCSLTINTFPDGTRYITGNRCEKGAGVNKGQQELPNLFKYKYDRVFRYKSLPSKQAHRGKVGIPRVLNIYENYPFWHTFFTELGFEVVLSTKSSRKVYERGISSIPSETACYPAKITHGHIMDLIDKGVDFIFYPAIYYERQEDKATVNHANCPVVIGYSEVIRLNVAELAKKGIRFLNPFMSFHSKSGLKKRLYDSLAAFDIPFKDISRAVNKGFHELMAYKKDIQQQGEKTLRLMERRGIRGIVLAGRPYHIDPAINHGIPELINSLGLAVLSEDSVAHLAKPPRPLRVLDQWTYHARLYRAATFTSTKANLDLVQLNSFGCGFDAVTTDQVEEILRGGGKIYTVLKIDEVSNLGAAKIRIRSLHAALTEREKAATSPRQQYQPPTRIEFTKAMRKNHTILVPQMAPIHFPILQSALDSCGYNLEILPTYATGTIDEGLKYVNNDACYPAIMAVGQYLAALKSGKYDLDNVSVLMTQTGGVCRASNYVGFIRKALRDAGYGQIPVIAMSAQGFEKNSGFSYSPAMLLKALLAVLYGDLIMRLLHRVRPYEKIKGSANLLARQWIERCRTSVARGSIKEFKHNVAQMVKDFDGLEIVKGLTKPRVGVVGEIYVKYHPLANNDLVKILEAEGAEAVVPDITDFILYSSYGLIFGHKYLSKGFWPRVGSELVIRIVEYFRQPIRRALRHSDRFSAPGTIYGLVKEAKRLVSIGNQYGEGWLLTAEMLRLIQEGAENIVCIQPFGCLPNHITGKGVIKAIRDLYPQANIAPIDYDSSASEVNQLNRIKLMLSKAPGSHQDLPADEANTMQTMPAGDTSDPRPIKHLNLL